MVDSFVAVTMPLSVHSIEEIRIVWFGVIELLPFDVVLCTRILLRLVLLALRDESFLAVRAEHVPVHVALAWATHAMYRSCRGGVVVDSMIL